MSTSTPDRFEQIHVWLKSLPASLALQLDTLRPASSDASFRRYFRLNSDTETFIVMDAPPEYEDCRPFVHVAGLLHKAGLNVPIIKVQNLAQGLLLLSDLGPCTYYQYLQNSASRNQAPPQKLYRDALTALVQLQQASLAGLPHYSPSLFMEELQRFSTWYVTQHQGFTLDTSTRQALHDIFNTLSHAQTTQPTVLVHRDFHSPNLVMIRKQDQKHYGPNPGVLDFQDALAGPLTYDLASLVTDARITWEEPQQLDWAQYYWHQTRATGLPIDTDFAQFRQAYEWMSLQRNLRILGNFARLYHRDNKPNYLAHIPRLNTYIRQVARRYNVFKPLMHLLDQLDRHASRADADRPSVHPLSSKTINASNDSGGWPR